MEKQNARNFPDPERFPLRDGPPAGGGKRRISDRTTQGSHSVIFVQVDRIEVQEERDSLVYFKRQFHRLSVTPELVAV
ncbi:hypothetical protein [Arthrobacter sp. efr-133-TYG-120]|uniref:hypothetical protein n=1 Tax=Arthrobacter sp. efr-133-TYG-120 TaxID=3040280 RepID=UPI002550A299|nr:hypothetical protein [Arthrobacter sp. efr-133-TYG-120]